MTIKNKLLNLIKYRGITFPKAIYDPSDIDWPADWQALHYDDIPKITRELNREVGKQHVLYKQAACALGRRSNTDDYLFQIETNDCQFAAVHLTWNKESKPDWPHAELYAHLQDWIDSVNKDTH